MNKKSGIQTQEYKTRIIKPETYIQEYKTRIIKTGI